MCPDLERGIGEVWENQCPRDLQGQEKGGGTGIQHGQHDPGPGGNAAAVHAVCKIMTFWDQREELISGIVDG